MMSSQSIYYEEEREYTSRRLIVIFGATFFMFVSLDNIAGVMASPILYGAIALSVASFLSILHYFILHYKPLLWIHYRKDFLLVLDMILLTFIIGIFGYNGIFSFPFISLLLCKMV